MHTPRTALAWTTALLGVVTFALPAISQTVDDPLSIEVAPLPAAVQELGRDLEAARTSAEKASPPQLIELEATISELSHVLQQTGGEDAEALDRVLARLRAAQGDLEKVTSAEDLGIAAALRDPLDLLSVALDEIVAEPDAAKRRTLASSLLEFVRPDDPTWSRDREKPITTFRTGLAGSPDRP